MTPRRPVARAGTRPRGFSYACPPGLIALMAQLLGQGQQGAILTEAVRSFLEGKGHPAGMAFNLRITAASISAVPGETVEVDLDALRAPGANGQHSKEEHANGTG